jgi:hypothetical protein
MLKISDILIDQIVSEAKRRDDEHISSGKLSASMLGNPLQWQVLKYLGVEPKEIDNYTYCKFQRGRDVEDFVFDKVMASGIKASGQEKAEYRNCVGLIDIFVPETKEIIEVKSTTNQAFKYIVKEGMAKENHILQAALYALAKEVDEFSLVYIASDDYRSCQFQYRTADYKDKVDSAIDEFEAVIEAKKIPKFEAKMAWQKIPQYSMYPEWTKLNIIQLDKKAKELYK